MTPIHIRVLRHSAFYSPLLMAIAGGFLEQEGLSPHYDVATPQDTVESGIRSGQVHVAQSAVAAHFALLAQGQACPVRHFAQINERDGFFLTRRHTGNAFDWTELAGKMVLVDHFFQPLAMFKYALDRAGVAFSSLDVVDAGDVASIDAAYRSGQGDYVHQQGPYAQQLEADGLGEVVAAVGDLIGPVAFSSLCASPQWLQTDMALAFMRAYRQARAATRELPATEIARLEAGFFPEIEPAVLARTVATYQQLGCWQPSPVISEAAFETTLDVFAYSGGIPRRFRYDELCCRPPDESP
jgi:NitT/TauT family transport system substrate-binding protein